MASLSEILFGRGPSTETGALPRFDPEQQRRQQEFINFLRGGGDENPFLSQGGDFRNLFQGGIRTGQAGAFAPVSPGEQPFREDPTQQFGSEADTAELIEAIRAQGIRGGQEALSELSRTNPFFSSGQRASSERIRQGVARDIGERTAGLRVGLEESRAGRTAELQQGIRARNAAAREAFAGRGFRGRTQALGLEAQSEEGLRQRQFLADQSQISTRLQSAIAQGQLGLGRAGTFQQGQQGRYNLIAQLLGLQTDEPFVATQRPTQGLAPGLLAGAGAVAGSDPFATALLQWFRGGGGGGASSTQQTS